MTTYHHWTGFRAVINGVSFNIISYINNKEWGYGKSHDVMQIALPNGQFAIISQLLPEKITT